MATTGRTSATRQATMGGVAVWPALSSAFWHSYADPRTPTQVHVIIWPRMISMSMFTDEDVRSAVSSLFESRRGERCEYRESAWGVRSRCIRVRLYQPALSAGVKRIYEAFGILTEDVYVQAKGMYTCAGSMDDINTSIAKLRSAVTAPEIGPEILVIYSGIRLQARYLGGAPPKEILELAESIGAPYVATKLRKPCAQDVWSLSDPRPGGADVKVEI